MLAVALVVFLAVLVQSSIGFGLGLIAMPVLVSLLGIRTAAPLVALVAMFAELVILIRYREAINLDVVKQLTLAAIVGIPVGIFTVKYVDGEIVNKVLGIIVIGYAAYALLSPKLPEFAGKAWSYFFGFLAGILGGAYNTGGPPVIIYGNCRSWPPDEFKSNLQGFFLVTGLVVLAVHGLSGNFTGDVWRNLLYALPGLVLGLASGFTLSHRINPILFRKIILVMLLFLGTSLLFL